jgi:hypothetical protein
MSSSSSSSSGECPCEIRWSNGTQITDANRNVLPGRQINLKIHCEGSSTYTDIEWSLPGQVFKSYSTSESAGTLTNLASGDLDDQTGTGIISGCSTLQMGGQFFLRAAARAQRVFQAQLPRDFQPPAFAAEGLAACDAPPGQIKGTGIISARSTSLMSGRFFLRAAARAQRMSQLARDFQPPAVAAERLGACDAPPNRVQVRLRLRFIHMVAPQAAQRGVK